jgi:hypothetical protein
MIIGRLHFGDDFQAVNLKLVFVRAGARLRRYGDEARCGCDGE